jgi:hypothetical protein
MKVRLNSILPLELALVAKDAKHLGGAWLAQKPNQLVYLWLSPEFHCASVRQA